MKSRSYAGLALEVALLYFTLAGLSQSLRVLRDGAQRTQACPGGKAPLERNPPFRSRIFYGT